MCKRNYYNNRVNDLAQSNAKKWWQQIKSLTGQDPPAGKPATISY